ncbi:MAG: hypothetical protein U0Q18_20990 [Bryobacteraceae bacterium]
MINSSSFASCLAAVVWLVLPAASQTPRHSSPGGYVGSKVCGACHSRIYSTYLKTGMGQSTVPGRDPKLVEGLPAPFSLFDQDSGQFFEVIRKEGKLYQSQYAVDHDGKETFRQTWPLDYVIGSGENGYGFAIWRNGYLFEAPLTYYSKSKIWGLSPGYEVHNYAFTRPILARCVGCHSGRPRPLAGRTGAYRDPPFKETAIGCENCHGPGARHVAERQRGEPASGGGSIVNPARLKGRLADDICIKCHQGGDVRVVQPGKQESDFRPGMPLDRVLAIFKAPLKRDSPPQSVLLEHYFGMTLSKCYRASAGRLRCITCHDPHVQRSAKEAADYYRARCLQCHVESACKIPAEKRLHGSKGDACTACHMPKRTVTTITHAALTDHSIAARPGEPYPEDAFETHAAEGTGLLHLTAEPGSSTPGLSPITLLEAYIGLVREGHKEYADKRDALLQKLSRDAPDQPAVLIALARKAASRTDTASAETAIAYLTRVVQTGVAAPEDYLLLSELHGRRNRHIDAIRMLELGSASNPYFREFDEQIAVHQIAMGKYGDARKTIRNGLALFPDDHLLRMLEQKVNAAMLDDPAPRP